MDHRNWNEYVPIVLTEPKTDSVLNDQLLEVYNRADHGDIPDLRLKGVILPFSKKGDLGSAVVDEARTILFCSRSLMLLGCSSMISTLYPESVTCEYDLLAEDGAWGATACYVAGHSTAD